MSQSPKRALIVIDVQNEYVSGNLLIEYPDVNKALGNIARAMDAATAAGIPVVVVRHIAPAESPIFARGSEGAALHPLVAERPRDHLVDTLTVIGFMTHNCDDATVRHAKHQGWKVELLHDASGSLPYANAVGVATAEEIHRVFTVVMNTGFAAVASTDAWLSAIERGEALKADSIHASNRRARVG